ncbi:MAG: class I SAM-dependent methyltransferase [Pseudomonadota bacterium]
MRGLSCRSCGAPLTRKLLDLGSTPLANAFLPNDPAAIAAERRFPLCAYVCEQCWLVQLDHDAPADAIFNDEYAYLSSFSESWVAHARRYAEAMTARLDLGPQSLVVEIASNDGYLLQHFVSAGIPVLGVEPAGNAAALAEAKGVPSRVMFFDADSAAGLAAQGVAADLIAANNVLAHVPDIRGFVRGFPRILKPEGVVTFEFPHLLQMLTKLQFDTIYHEHYSYLSLLSVEAVLRDAGLRPFDVEHLPTHGGSLRLFACHAGAPMAETAALEALRVAEKDLATLDAYAPFAAEVTAFAEGFRRFVADARSQGLRIAGYGAAAKGNTMLNYCGLGHDDIIAVADRNPQKQGRLLPGSHIPCVSPEALLDMRPDIVVILPWNLRDEIMAQMAAIRDYGGRFAVVEPGAAGGVAIV